MSEQESIRCVLMRGGTSKGLYFHESDLPGPGAARDALLLRLMGSPDVLQIDGLGGSRPITSKVAIVKPSARDDADVDYTFAQVEIDRAHVGYTGNCGNISSGVGPFAIDERMLAVHDGQVDVRIFNTNTEKLLIASVQVRDGQAAVLGDCAIPGVPGTGAEIVMDWTATIGAKTGTLLPTGKPADDMVLERGDTVRGTLCDVGNPVLWLRTEDFGLSGNETPDDIDNNSQFLAEMKEVRGKAAVMLAMCTDWHHADEQSPGIPMVGFVAPAGDYTTLNGAPITAGQMDLRVRLMFMNRLHQSIAGSGSMCLAAASRIPGSVVADVATTHQPNTLLIGHPSGVMSVHVSARSSTTNPAGVTFDLLGMSRTARRLMQGVALYPTADLANTTPAPPTPPATTTNPDDHTATGDNTPARTVRTVQSSAGEIR